MKVLKLSSSTYYYYKNTENCILNKQESVYVKNIPGYAFTTSGDKINDEEIIKKLGIINNDSELIESNYGYRKMVHHFLREEKIIINHKKMYRLCKENGFLKKRIKRFKPLKNLSENRTITKSNSLWELDIKYIKIDGESRFSYVCEVIDVFDRTIIDYHIGLNCKAKDISLLLERAINKREIPSNNNLVIRTDNGTQFTSKSFKDKIDELNLYHERIPNATPNKNAHIESFHSILEFEFVNKYYFNSFSDVYEKLNIFINNYNYKRIHSRIGYMTPNEFYLKYKGINQEKYKISA